MIFRPFSVRLDHLLHALHEFDWNDKPGRVRITRLDSQGEPMPQILELYRDPDDPEMIVFEAISGHDAEKILKNLRRRKR